MTCSVFDVDANIYVWLIIVTTVAIFIASTKFWITPEDIIKREEQAIEETKPITKKVDAGDGCTIYFYHGNGIKQTATTKFVRCEKSTVDMERKWQCGTTKSPRTCTESVITTEVKK